MATLHVIGKTLVDAEEIFNKRFSGELSALRNIHDFKASHVNMEFTDATIPVNTLPNLHEEIRKDFKEIGIGKPLSIEIATVYTGEYKKFLGGRKDVIVVSGVKNSQTFQGTSRAINIKSEKVNEKDYLTFEAFGDGTKIVYYTPAMDAESTVVSFEIMFDNFDTGLFETISGLLTSAAGMPVFLPVVPYLLGGSQLVNIGSKLGDALFSGHPNLAGTIPIEFDSPIIPPTEPKEFVIYNEKDRNEFSDLQVSLFKDQSPQLRLTNKNGNIEYKGSAPYMIVILNGAQRQDLEAFSSTIASAAILKKFYGTSDRTGEITSVLQEAMQLYNDSSYKLKGEKLKKRIDVVAKDSEEYKKLKSLYNAYSVNIQSENFKLPILLGGEEVPGGGEGHPGGEEVPGGGEGHPGGGEVPGGGEGHPGGEEVPGGGEGHPGGEEVPGGGEGHPGGEEVPGGGEGHPGGEEVPGGGEGHPGGEEVPGGGEGHPVGEEVPGGGEGHPGGEEVPGGGEGHPGGEEVPGGGEGHPGGEEVPGGGEGHPGGEEVPGGGEGHPGGEEVPGGGEGHPGGEEVPGGGEGHPGGEEVPGGGEGGGGEGGGGEGGGGEGGGGEGGGGEGGGGEGGGGEGGGGEGGGGEGGGGEGGGRD